MSVWCQWQRKATFKGLRRGRKTQQEIRGFLNKKNTLPKMLSKGGRRWTKTGCLKSRGAGVAFRAQLTLAQFSQQLSCPAFVMLCHRKRERSTCAFKVFTLWGVPCQTTQWSISRPRLGRIAPKTAAKWTLEYPTYEEISFLVHQPRLGSNSSVGKWLMLHAGLGFVSSGVSPSFPKEFKLQQSQNMGTERQTDLKKIFFPLACH